MRCADTESLRARARSYLDGYADAREGIDSPRALRQFFAEKIYRCDIAESLFGVQLTPGVRSLLFSTLLSAGFSVAWKLWDQYSAKA